MALDHDGKCRRDPFWQAKVSSEIARNPARQSDIERLCSRCHMPMAYTEAVNAGQTPAIFGPQGFLDLSHPLHEAAIDGVSCTLCHQIQPQNLGQPESFNGHFVIDTSTEPPRRIVFGPYPNPNTLGISIMRTGSGYTPQQGTHLKTSAMCATCHTLYTPFVTDQGQQDRFPEQVPYLEWQHSSYGDGQTGQQNCQDCHMPLADGGVVLYGGWPAHTPFYQHYFVGGNSFMLQILRAHVDELKLRASTTEFSATIQRTLDQLQQQTAEVSIPQATLNGETMDMAVRIDSHVGHKFPTAYPSRRAWLHVTVRDATGNPMFESGRFLPHGGIQGNDADLNPATLEPHYTTITEPDQVQIYEAVMHDSSNHVTYTLFDASGYLKDNRLLPAGFDKATAGPDIAVVGGAAQDADFVGGSDQVHYQVDVSGHQGPFHVTVELLYQSLSYVFAQDLLSDVTPEVQTFAGYYAGADRTPVTISTAEVTLP